MKPMDEIAVKEQLLALRDNLDKLSRENGTDEITEAYTSDDERVDRIRLRGPSVVAVQGGCNRCRATMVTLGEGTGLLRCSKCKLTLYCSRTCQSEDWVYHKKWCAAFVKSGVNPKKALWSPLDKSALPEYKAPVTQTKKAHDSVRTASQNADSSVDGGVVERKSTDVEIPLSTTKVSQAPVLSDKPKTKKSVQFAEAVKEGGVDEETAESGLEIGDFTVIPQGTDSMAWMQAFMHYPFEVC